MVCVGSASANDVGSSERAPGAVVVGVVVVASWIGSSNSVTGSSCRKQTENGHSRQHKAGSQWRSFFCLCKALVACFLLLLLLWVLLDPTKYLIHFGRGVVFSGPPD